MARETTQEALIRERVIAIVRVERDDLALRVAVSLHAGGIACLEVALTTPGALEAMRELSRRLPDLHLGAGTVCTTAEVEASARAGARFIVTPVTLPELVDAAHAHDMAVAMGAFSPTEIHTADRAGADLIKLFPAASVGPDYLRAVRAPFPRLRLVPTGGVGLHNASDWLAAGAVALGVGGALTDPSAITGGRYDELTDRARRLLARIAPFRAGGGGGSGGGESDPPTSSHA